MTLPIDLDGRECESLTGSGEMTTISTSSGSTDWVRWSLVREERFSFPEIGKRKCENKFDIY